MPPQFPDMVSLAYLNRVGVTPTSKLDTCILHRRRKFAGTESQQGDAAVTRTRPTFHFFVIRSLYQHAYHEASDTVNNSIHSLNAVSRNYTGHENSTPSHARCPCAHLPHGTVDCIPKIPCYVLHAGRLSPTATYVVPGSKASKLHGRISHISLAHSSVMRSSLSHLTTHIYGRITPGHSWHGRAD